MGKNNIPVLTEPNVFDDEITATKLSLTGDTLNIATQKTPASATATGTKGDIVHDAGFIYVCTATDTWERVAIATW